MRIRIHFWNQGFYDKKCEKKLQLSNFLGFCFLDFKLQFTYPKVSIKDAQATGEALSPQKKTSSTSKHEITSLFYFLLARQKNHLCKKRIFFRRHFLCAMTPLLYSFSSCRVCRGELSKFFTFFYICGSFLPSWIRIQQFKLMRILIHNPDVGYWLVNWQIYGKKRNILPEAMPTHMPIMKPIFILSRQEGPWLLYPAGIGILIKAYFTSEIKCFDF